MVHGQKNIKLSYWRLDKRQRQKFGSQTIPKTS